MSFSAAVALFGTLIIAAPTADGLVVAADSRVSLHDKQFCDLDTKILEVKNVDRTVIALTGVTSLQRGGDDLLAYCRQNVLPFKILDLRQEFANYVESAGKDARTISISSFQARLRELFAKLSDAQLKNFKARYAGKIVSELIVASFDAKAGSGAVRHAFIVEKPNGTLVIEKEDVERFSPDAKFRPSIFGEVSYADRALNDGTLKKFFAEPQTARLFDGHPRASTVETQQATHALTDVIQAVSKRMETIPSKNTLNINVTVGGPVDVILLGKDARPERLQWRAPTPPSTLASGLTAANIKTLRIKPTNPPFPTGVTPRTAVKMSVGWGSVPIPPAGLSKAIVGQEPAPPIEATATAQPEPSHASQSHADTQPQAATPSGDTPELLPGSTAPEPSALQSPEKPGYAPDIKILAIKKNDPGTTLSPPSSTNYTTLKVKTLPDMFQPEHTAPAKASDEPIQKVKIIPLGTSGPESTDDASASSKPAETPATSP